jgi:hypothetical protein
MDIDRSLLMHQPDEIVRAGRLALGECAVWVDAVLPYLAVPLPLPPGEYDVLLHRERAGVLGLVELVPTHSRLHQELFGRPGSLDPGERGAVEDYRGRLLGNCDIEVSVGGLLPEGSLFFLVDAPVHRALVDYEEAFSRRPDTPSFWEDCLAPKVQNLLRTSFVWVRLEGLSTDLLAIETERTPLRTLRVGTADGELLTMLIDIGEWRIDELGMP